MALKEDHNGYGFVFQEAPGVDTWDGSTIPVLGPDGQYFEAYVDIWEERAPANGGKHTRKVRVRAKNWKDHSQVPAGGRVEREATAPVGTPSRIGREPGPPPAFNHPGAQAQGHQVKPSSMPYGNDDSYDSWAAQDYAQRDRYDYRNYPDDPRRVGGPDE